MNNMTPIPVYLLLAIVAFHLTRGRGLNIATPGCSMMDIIEITALMDEGAARINVNSATMCSRSWGILSGISYNGRRVEMIRYCKRRFKTERTPRRSQLLTNEG